MVRSIIGSISTSRLQPIASTTNTIPNGTMRRRMQNPPRGPWLDDPRPRRNKQLLRVSMAPGLLGFRPLREPLRLLGGLEEDLRIHLPGSVLPHQGVELVLGEAQGVHEAVLGLQDVRDLRLVPLHL